MSLPDELQNIMENEWEDLLDHIDNYSNHWGDQEVAFIFTHWLDTRMGGIHKITRNYENKSNHNR